MFGRMLCSLGLHRVVTTRDGKPAALARANRPAGAAAFIHCFCYRPDCDFHVIVDTHNGTKVTPPKADADADADA